MHVEICLLLLIGINIVVNESTNSLLMILHAAAGYQSLINFVLEGRVRRGLTLSDDLVTH